MADEPPYALLIWRGCGELNGRPVKAWDELFVGRSTIRTPHLLKLTGGEVLEAFKFFGP